jgi:hypothetical protein
MWQRVVNSVTMRHVDREVTVAEVAQSLTASEWATLELLTELDDNTPSMRAAIETVASYCNVLTPKEIFDRIYEEEIVPLERSISREQVSA